MVLGAFSATSMEEVAQTSPSGLRWLQVYMFKDRNLTRSLVIQAERAGYRAMVVTVDQPILSPSTNTSLNPPPNIFLPHIGMGSRINVEDVNKAIDPSVTWEDIDWLRGLTGLPVVLKGILSWPL